MVRKKPQNRSIRSDFMLLLAVFGGVCGVMLTLGNIYGIRIARRQATDLNRNVIILQCNMIDNQLSYADQYLLTLTSMEESVEAIASPESTDLEYISASLGVLRQLQQGVRQYNTVDATFLYLPEQEVYLTAHADGITYACRSSAKERIVEYLDSGASRSGYFALEAEGGYVIGKALSVGGGYAGFWCTVDTLLSSLQDSRISQIDYVLFASGDLQVLDPAPMFRQPLSLQAQEGGDYVELKGVRYLVSSGRLSRGELSLLALVKEERIRQRFGAFYGILSGMLGALCFFLLLTLLLCRRILRPMEELIQAMNSVRGGDWDVPPPAGGSHKELRLLVSAFQLMMGEIKQLKMDVYEERLQRQRIRRQYYQLQIQPHFFMNSLNMVYQLAQAGDTELVQQMTMHLSRYFRSSLRNKEEEISLSEELTLVEEYLEIQRFRYPCNLEYSIQAEPQALQKKLPPLAVQTFVENAIKYAIDMSQVTRLACTAVLDVRESGPYLVVTVADNGPGFPPKVAEALRRGEAPLDGERKCLGIYNVQQRLSMIYGGAGYVRVGQGPKGGALVEIGVPAGGGAFPKDKGGEE